MNKAHFSMGTRVVFFVALGALPGLALALLYLLSQTGVLTLTGGVPVAAAILVTAILIAAVSCYGLKSSIVRPINRLAEYARNLKTPGNSGDPPVTSIPELAELQTRMASLAGEHWDTETKLQQAQKMEAMGQLTGGVAHDFNNLLAIIIGNAEILADDLDDDNDFLQAILRAAGRGDELTQLLLSFSREQVLEPEVVSMNELISNIANLLRRTLEERIEIEAVISAGLWNCEVDRYQLENALVNLAANARDAMPDAGKLTIEAGNARLDDEYAAAQAEVVPGQYVMLAVTDTGTGMDTAIRDRIFEPFYTTKQSGSGLGLSMVYGFVKQSRGHISIYSEPGEGTTIRIYLPRSHETDTVDLVRPVEEIPPARGETLLVVEDSDDVRSLIQALLTGFGYNVVTAANGPDAIEKLASIDKLDLLLTDVMLPGGMNGRQIADEFKNRLPGIKVLYMSGYTQNAIMHHGRLDSDAVLLQKPFRRDELQRAVGRALNPS